MTTNYHKQKNFLTILILSTLFIFISSVSLYIYETEKNHRFEEMEKRMEIELSLLSRYQTDLIIRNDYSELNNYLKSIIQHDDDISQLEVKINGIIFFSHNLNNESLSKNHSFSIGDKKIDIILSKSIDTLIKQLNHLKITLITFVFIFTIIIGYTLWYLLSKWILIPLNDEITIKTKKIQNYSDYLDNIIDSLPSHIAIIDQNGNITRTNEAWASFAKKNGYGNDPFMLHRNYFQVCDPKQQSKNCDNLCEKGILEVLNGEKDKFLETYDCSIPNKSLWFNIRANRFDSGDKSYTIITHEDITNVKLAQNELEKINKFYSALSDSNLALLHAKNEKDLLDRITKTIQEGFGYMLVWIGYKVNNSSKDVNVVSSSGEHNGYLDSINVKWSDCDFGNGPTGRSIKEKKAIIINDTQTDERFKPWKENAKKRGYRATAAFPIIHNNEVIGSLSIYSSQKDIFIAEEVRLLEKLAANVAFGIESIRDKEKVASLSVTDDLTKIYNRRKINELLLQEISRSKRTKEAFSVILLDIDFFKKVNDNYGHQIGDAILIEFTKIIQNSIREVDFLGRWGGEEFIVLLPNTNTSNSLKLAQRILESVESYNFPTVGKKTASIGAYTSNHNDSINSIIEKVDIALYRAKETGRNKVVLFKDL